MPYTVTINIANAGTPLKNGSKSKTGHVWYQTSNGVESLNFGFSPDENHVGKPYTIMVRLTKMTMKPI